MATIQKKPVSPTKLYSFFKISAENRPLDLRKHKKLKQSMQRYGFLKSFPIVCVRNASGELIVKDGQHRLAIAEELGIAVHYVVENVDFDVAEVNSTSKIWTVNDYAQRFAADGNPNYIEAIELAESFGLPTSRAFSLLAGTTTFSNITDEFQSGRFVVKERDYARQVASLYSAMVERSDSLKNVRFLAACMSVCRVSGFDPARLISGADRCRDRLLSYSTRDAYLVMIEEVYNFGRTKLASIKIEAIQAMRERNPSIAV